MRNFSLLPATLFLLCGAAWAGEAPLAANPPLPAEPVPNTLELPAEYPPSWVFAHDFNFYAIVDGKIAVMDVAAETRPFKGYFDAGQFAAFQSARTKPELYVAQTFLSRRTYGERTDVLTIFSRRTLQPLGEIILPPKRMQVVTQPNALQLTPDENWAFVSNFTPAQSVTVVDLQGRKVLGEVPTPACNFTFPTGARGFSTLCGDGTLATFHLDEAGGVEESTRTEAFIDVDADPIYVKNALLNGITYFPSFRGRVQPVDFRGQQPKVLPAWSMLEGVPAEENWAPGGWHVAAGAGETLFVLMHRDAAEGTHKYGGTEVWAFEAATGKRLRRIPLQQYSVSIAVTQGAPGYLVATNQEMELDIYAAESGEHLRTLHVGGAATPMVVHAR